MLVSPAVTQWTHPSEHVTPPPPSSPPPQYDPPDGPPNHDAYPNEKKSFDGSYKSSSFHGSRGEYEDYDSHPQRHQGGGYGGRHDGGQGGPWRGGSGVSSFAFRISFLICAGYQREQLLTANMMEVREAHRAGQVCPHLHFGFLSFLDWCILITRERNFRRLT